jgi:hypothetical protein
MGIKTDKRELTVDNAAPDKLTDFANANIDPTNSSERNKPSGINSTEAVAFLLETNNIMLISEAEK